MRGTRGIAAGVVAALALIGCAPAEEAGPQAGTEGAVDEQDAAADEPPHPGPIAPEEGPFHPDAQMRPDLMEVHPDAASPGDDVELHFRQEITRGVGFVLEERAGDSWEVRYFLTVPDIGAGDDPPDDLRGSWFPPDNPDRLEWPAVGVDGSIPGRVRIPEPATPGEYRICSAMDPESFCAELTITP